MNPYRRIALSLVVACMAGCGSDTPPVTPTTVRAVNQIQITPADLTLEVGASSSVTAIVLDQDGQAIVGVPVIWSSSNTPVLTIDSSTGIARGIKSGTGIISARSGAIITRITVTVTPPLITSVVVSTSRSEIAAGQTLALAVSIRDRTGAVLTDRVVIWTSSTPRVATVNATGLVTMLSPGTTTVTATSEGVAGSVTLVATAPAGSVAPLITAISPATIAPGAAITVAGANFATGTTNNQLYVGGVLVPLTSATATQLTAVLPLTYPCASIRSVPVEVLTVGGVASSTKAMASATPRTLAVGQSFMVADIAGRSCTELPASGSYLVSVFNASTSSAQATTLELTGASGGAALASTSATTSRSSPTALRAPSIHAAGDDAMTAERQEHLDHLAFNTEVMRRLGSPGQYARVPRVAASGAFSHSASTSSASAAQTTALEVVPTEAGATAHINFYHNDCSLSSATRVTARVVYAGPKAIVLEDNNAPLAGRMDGDLIAMAKEWETVSYPLLVKNFGDPLAYDARTDNNGRIIMMFTPLVNSTAANLLGFVWSCDFYPPTSDKSVGASNQAEIFYARVPTDTSSTGTSLDSRGGWKRQMPPTMAHESKHIASFAERMAASPRGVLNYEESWLEEATAQLEAEMYARSLHGNTWRGNAPYAGVLACELRPTDPTCNGSVLGMYNNFGWLVDYFRSIETTSILSTTAGDGAALYGGAWLFTRWLTDTYGGDDEAAFMSSIVKNFQKSGVANLVQRSGRPFAELFGQFTLMLAADELPNISAPFVEQSWNLPAVWEGYADAKQSARWPAAPLSLRQSTFGSFSQYIGALKGGSAMLLRIEGGQVGGTQLLDLHSEIGGALSSTSGIGITVLRIK